MIMGTVTNAAAIIAGAAVGLAIAKAGGQEKSKEISQAVLKVLGLAVVIMGAHMTLEEHNYFPVVVCLALGTFIGEMLRIEAWIERFGTWLKKVSRSRSDSFVNGFVFSSVLFCVGATAILGALRDGMTGDASLLYIKSLLDGITSIILASTMGVGVMFSAIPILLYQGAISLASSRLTFMIENPIFISGISVTGGVMVVGIGLNLLGVTKLRIANMLPALALIPIYDALHLYFAGG